MSGGDIRGPGSGGRRVLAVLLKDVALGPRSPLFFWAVVFPVMATVLVQLVFGSLFDPQPRLGIVDEDASQITASVRGMEGIRLTLLDSEAELKDQVAANDLDAGLILPEGFDEAVREGRSPILEFYVAGESMASDRLILAVTTVDLVRSLEGSPAPVDVQVAALGDEQALSVSSRLVPALVLFSLLIAGVFATGFSLVEEKERGTLDAVLVTPATMPDVLLAKASLGLILSLTMALVTLALNRALGSHVGALLLSLLLGAVTCTEIGLIYGTAAKDVKGLYTLVKSLNILLAGPVIFYLFPDWPQWIAKLFPTYWFIDPIYRVALQGAGLDQVWTTMVVAAGICVLLLGVVIALGRRMQARGTTA